jgi:threonine/homoserine/homoserine lactone efflux protein
MAFVIVSIVALVVGFAGSLPLAGPIAVLVVSSAAAGKYRAALTTALGAAVAEGGYAFLAFWGFATFLARYPLVLPISHGITAAILVALGIRFLFFFHAAESKGKEDDTHAARFWVGLSISALNPTLLATWGAVTTFLYARQLLRFSGVLAIPFGAFAAAGVALWGATTVAVLKRFRHSIPARAITWTVRAMGLAMIGVGAWSAIELAKYVEHGPSPGDGVTSIARSEAPPNIGGARASRRRSSVAKSTRCA